MTCSQAICDDRDIEFIYLKHKREREGEAKITCFFFFSIDTGYFISEGNGEIKEKLIVENISSHDTY